MGVRETLDRLHRERIFDRIYRDQIRRIDLRRGVLIASTLTLAILVIWIVTTHSSKQVDCAAQARDEMIQWYKGKTVAELKQPMGKLKEMQQQHYQECMKR